MVKPDKLNQFHLCLYKDVYPIKGSQTNEIEDFLEETKFHILASDIAFNLPDIEKQWSTQSINYSYILNGEKHTERGKLNFNKGKGMAAQILNGQLSKKTFNSVACYYLYNFFSLLDEGKKGKDNLHEIKKFFNVFIPQTEHQHHLMTALINRAIERSTVASLWKMSIDIDNDWQCKFIENNNPDIEKDISEEGSSMKLDSMPTTIFETHLSEELSGYYNKIINEYSEIRLDVVNFRLPITNYIKIPIFESNQLLVEKKGKLEKKLNNILKNSSHSEIKEESIRKKIRDIEVILSKSHDILNIINLGKDIFIKAPAGSGKSTTLRWMTYELAKNHLKDSRNKTLPIFIELKYYTKEVKNLFSLIIDTLSSFGFDESDLTEYDVLLLLDGYDEYDLNTNKLFKEIIEFKRKNNNCTIIFTGRVQPNFSAHNLDFVVYRLAELGDEDIRSMFQSYLGKVNGSKSFELVEGIGVKQYLRNPLYSAFVLVLIKDNLCKGEFDIQDIKEVITNKGLLLQTLIVDKFIRSYEADKADVSLEKRKNYKCKEIDILAKLAFQMTYGLNDTEQIELEKVESFCLRRGLSKKDVNSFISHNILKENKGFISFDKKEIRLFFTAKELVRLIEKHEHYVKYKDSLETNRVKRVLDSNKEMSTWEYIEEYLLGMIELEQLIDFKLFPIEPHKVLLSHCFFAHFKLLLRKFDQGYLFSENTHLTQAYVLKLISMNVLAYKKVKENGYRHKYLISPYYYFRRIPERFTFLRKFLSKEDISKSNIDFLDRIMAPEYRWFTCIPRRYNLGVGFSEYSESYKQTYLIDDIHRNIFFMGVFDKESKISFTNHDIVYFIYHWFFNFYGKYENKSLRVIYGESRTYSRLRFVERNLREDFDSFIIYFYKQNPDPSTFIYLKLLYKLKKSGWDYPIRNYSNYPRNIQDKVLSVLFDGVINIHAIKGFPYDKYLFDLVESIEDDLLKKRLSDKALSLFLSHELDDEKKVNAFILLLTTGEIKNIEVLVKLIQDEQSQSKNIILKALTRLKAKLKYNTRVFKQLFITQFLKEIIGLYPKNQDVLELLLKEVYITTPELTLNIIGLANDSDSELFYAILCFFSKNKPQEAVEFLIEQLDNYYYDTWCYDILFRIDHKYHFKFKEKFDANSISLYITLTRFEEDSEFLINTSHIRQLYYLCSDYCIDVFYRLLKSKSHYEKLKNLSDFHTLKKIIDEKVATLFDYQIKINK
jgi:hypothetical protein